MLCVGKEKSVLCVPTSKTRIPAASAWAITFLVGETTETYGLYGS